MAKYNLEQLKELDAIFKQLVYYTDKLKFFDEHFDITPFGFPPFQPDLQILMQGDEIDLLVDIFSKERKLSVIPSHTFSADGQDFVFNVIPANRNREFFNEYIINKFLTTDIGYNTAIKQIGTVKGSKRFRLLHNLQDAKELAITINGRLKDNAERSYRNQFLQVFYSGFLDQKTNFKKKFPLKKKLLELYLYAQGILFGKYIEALESILTTEEMEVLSEDSILKPKLILLNELGVLQFLYKENNMDAASIADMIIDLLDSPEYLKDEIIGVVTKFQDTWG